MQDKVNLSFSPGACYMLKNKFLFELSINILVGVNYTTQKKTFSHSSVEQTSNSFNLTTSVTGANSLMFGCKFLFGNRVRSGKS